MASRIDMASRIEAIKRALAKEKPGKVIKDVGGALMSQFNPDTGSVGGDVAEFAKRVVRGGVGAAAYPFTAPAGLISRLGKGAMKNAADLQASHTMMRDVETDKAGTQDEEIDALMGKYGPLTGGALSVLKGTAEGAAGAQGGRMLGQAFQAASRDQALQRALQDTTGRLGPKKKPWEEQGISMKEYFMGKDVKRGPSGNPIDPFTGKETPRLSPKQQMGEVAGTTGPDVAARIGYGNVPPPMNNPPLYKGNVTNDIIAFETGELSTSEIIKLFQHLVDTGQAWQLQGMYGRVARDLIKAGKVFVRE